MRCPFYVEEAGRQKEWLLSSVVVDCIAISLQSLQDICVKQERYLSYLNAIGKGCYRCDQNQSHEPTESTDLFAATLTGSKNTSVFNNIKSG